MLLMGVEEDNMDMLERKPFLPRVNLFHQEQIITQFPYIASLRGVWVRSHKGEDSTPRALVKGSWGGYPRGYHGCSRDPHLRQEPELEFP